MNVTFPKLEENDAEQPLLGKLRQILRTIEIALSRVRIDDAIIIGGGAKIARHLSGTKTWDPASVSDGAQTSTTVTVTGAALGDEVTCSFSNSLQLMRMSGYVSAANTVTVVLSNNTGGAIDLSSGILRASVWQH